VFTVTYELNLHAVHTNLMNETDDKSTKILRKDFLPIHGKIKKVNGQKKGTDFCRNERFSDYLTTMLRVRSCRACAVSTMRT
jgi:ribosomal protein S3AE